MKVPLTINDFLTRGVTVFPDRIAIVDKGRVIRTGTVEELISDTIGMQQRLSVTLSHVPERASLAPLHWDQEQRRASCLIENAAVELPRIMQNLHQQGAAVDQVVLASSTLQDVFLHLTGQELRE